MGEGTRDRQAEAERCRHAQEENHVSRRSQEDRRRSTSEMGEAKAAQKKSA